MTPAAERVLTVLGKRGLLLKQDKELPSVVGLVTGESLATSWWSHPKGRLIFRVLSELDDHQDVLFVKLLLGKDTLVHRSLFPAVLAVATAREPWQLGGLPPAARALWKRIEATSDPVLTSGADAKELASRLLVHAAPVHTESGKHELAVESWAAWARRAGVASTLSASGGRVALERAAAAIGVPESALPWR